MNSVNSFGLVVLLLTLILASGIIYSTWITMSGFGGEIGKSLKIIGVGILLLSLHVIDEILSAVSGVGSQSLFKGIIEIDNLHRLMVLVGFLVLAVGLSKMTKLVKTLKA